MQFAVALVALMDSVAVALALKDLVADSRVSGAAVAWQWQGCQAKPAYITYQHQQHSSSSQKSSCQSTTPAVRNVTAPPTSSNTTTPLLSASTATKVSAFAMTLTMFNDKMSDTEFIYRC